MVCLGFLFAPRSVSLFPTLVAILVPTTLNMETASQHALLRIPLESTARLLNNFRPAPQAEGDEGTLRRAEEDGVDVDARAQPHAGPSGDAREQTLDVPRVQLYDGSKSAVRYLLFQPRLVPLKRTRFLYVAGVQRTRIS